MSDVTSTFNSLSSTESSNSPSGATVIGSGLDDNLRMIQSLLAAWRDQTGWGILTLTSVAGTNTITATLATAGSVTFGPTALAAGMKFLLSPAVTNTGATTLNITSPNGGSALGAKNVFAYGTACVGGELVSGVPCVVEYDGTQFNILQAGPIALSGTTATTFTFDGSGGTTGSITVTWQKIGSVVSMKIPSVLTTTGTGSTSLTSNTALPASIRPTNASDLPCNTIEDNASAAANAGIIRISSGGLISIFKNITGAAFSNSATAGTATATSVTYYLA